MMSGSIAKAWSDDRIADGVDWEKEIFEAIDGARVAVLLVTANFLTSDFILQKETPRFLGRSAEKRGVRTNPPISSDVRGGPQMSPRAVDGLSWCEQNCTGLCDQNWNDDGFIGVAWAARTVALLVRRMGLCGDAT